MPKASNFASLFLGSMVLCAACGGSGPEPPVTGVNDSIYTSSVQTLIAESSGGGFTPQPPPGSQCLVGAKRYTLTVAERDFQYVRCEGNGRDPYLENSGGRTLTESEYATLEPLLRALKVVKMGGGCITDSPVLSVTVTTSLGQQQYIDDGSQCSQPDKPNLDRGAINDVLTRFDTFAMPKF
jgi:hypothetical protein